MRAAFLIIGIAIGLALLAQQRAPSGDPLRPDLGARVRMLEQEMKTPSGDVQEISARLRTLWEWGNAYALTGGPIPVDFPSGIAQNFRGLRSARGSSPEFLAQVNDFVARYVWELQIKDENPNALGKVELSHRGPFRAGERVTLQQTYTVGDLPIQPGGGIVLAVTRNSDDPEPDSGGESSVSIRSTNPAARLEKTEAWGEWTSFITRSTLSYRLKEGTLRKGDQVIITYANLRVQSWTNDRVLLPLTIDPDGKGRLLTPRWPSYEVIGGREARGVNAVAPSIVRPGEKFTLAVRTEDAARNLASGPNPGYDVSLNGKVIRNIAAGGPALAQVDGLSVREPGVYRFQARSKDGALTAASNPVWVRTDPPYRVYWGDTHGHSGFAEGQGSPDGYFRFGRDVARLDFLILSEHDLWMDDAEWRALEEATEKYLAPGKFTTILGYEWTMANAFGGHHNVYFRTPRGRRRVPVQATANLAELYQGLNKQYDPNDVLIIPHAHQAGDWTQNDARMERLAEITSGHGTFEFFGNRYLQNGFEIGFVGSSDNHVGHPGYAVRNAQQGGLAAALAPENTPAAIFDALRSRSAYATTGDRILVDVQLNGGRMGQRLADSAERKISCRAMGTAPIESVDLVKNGQVVYQKRYAETSSFDPHTWVLVKFASDTEVFSRANPRGSRPWTGDIEVEGARLAGLRTPSFLAGSDRVARDSGNPNRLDFTLVTRGRGKGLLLELEAASPASGVHIRTRQSREQPGSQGPADRAPASLAAEDLRFRLGDLPAGRGLREFRVGKNVDTIEVQALPASASLDQVFEYTDHDNPQPGDYYYLRVTQVDGGMAWSSPMWVGGKRGGSPRK
ncbi:MAG TPA: DUF3604 domain-containing protein [Bryobacteraceae bacterium]|nr:DUF3604 domain-containing protein [Bryobacteraceae bacterium]